MQRNITAAQKHAPDFHKSHALAPTNQRKYDYFLYMVQKTQKNIFSRSEIRNKNPRRVFLDFILFFNIAVEKFRKKISSSWSSRKRFF